MIESLQIFEQAQEAIQFLRKNLDQRLHNPRIVIVCGSGLGGLAETVSDSPKAEYQSSSIPHFPSSTGEHSSKYGGFSRE
jgi:purine-nucleoside phosphorylase